MLKRCPWCLADPHYIAYHDVEWGVPVYDDATMFEFLVLEGAQAGLSWLTILKRRQDYREAYDFFKVDQVALYSPDKVKELLANNKIIRNRRKIEASVLNAQAFLRVRDEFGTFQDYIWDFVGGKPIINAWHSLNQLPAQTDLSRRMSKDLSKRGFKFVGPVICYSFMQAIGLVNDHLVDCFRYAEINDRIISRQSGNAE
ncbi:DNA-3-methyladenine glycosylase I [bacterium]|nr:DNA-3-methyladenine glycosylase I [bacterium]